MHSQDPPVHELRCPSCSSLFEDSSYPVGRCHPCDENLNVVYPKGSSSLFENGGLLHTQGMWRYKDRLPVEKSFRSGMLVGATPIYDYGLEDGVNLFVKDETKNPSGSLKDRASEVIVSIGKKMGVEGIITASTGNAATSLACIGAYANIPVVVVVPADIPKTKLKQIQAYGAKVIAVREGYDAAYRLVNNLCKDSPWLNRSTGVNPYTREGKKTCSFEIYEHFNEVSSAKDRACMPDWIIVPTGDGNIISAIWKGLKELQQAGLLTKLPHLLAAQAEGSASVYHTFKHSKNMEVYEVRADTIADSISVNLPLDGRYAVRSLQESKGDSVLISDEDILKSMNVLAKERGLLAEPSSAITYAAFKKAVRENIISPRESALCLITGSGMKNLDVLDTFNSKLSIVDANSISCINQLIES